MKYDTFTLFCFIGFFELNYTCYAYAISYNACKYCMMLNINNPISLRNSNNLMTHIIRPNTGSNMNSRNVTNDYLNNNYLMNNVYIRYSFDTPNISKIANTSNTTKISDTSDTVNSIDNYMDNSALKYTYVQLLSLLISFRYYNFM